MRGPYHLLATAATEGLHEHLDEGLHGALSQATDETVLLLLRRAYKARVDLVLHRRADEPRASRRALLGRAYEARPDLVLQGRAHDTVGRALLRGSYEPRTTTRTDRRGSDEARATTGGRRQRRAHEVTTTAWSDLGRAEEPVVTTTAATVGGYASDGFQ